MKIRIAHPHRVLWLARGLSLWENLRRVIRAWRTPTPAAPKSTAPERDRKRRHMTFLEFP